MSETVNENANMGAGADANANVQVGLPSRQRAPHRLISNMQRMWARIGASASEKDPAIAYRAKYADKLATLSNDVQWTAEEKAQAVELRERIREELPREISIDMRTRQEKREWEGKSEKEIDNEAVNRTGEKMQEAKWAYLHGSYVMENTTCGNVLMTFQSRGKTFEYWSDKSVPPYILDMVARKFVVMNKCRPIYVDMAEELERCNGLKQIALDRATAEWQKQTANYGNALPDKYKNAILKSLGNLKERSNRFSRVGALTEAPFFTGKKVMRAVVKQLGVAVGGVAAGALGDESSWLSYKNRHKEEGVDELIAAQADFERKQADMGLQNERAFERLQAEKKSWNASNNVGENYVDENGVEEDDGEEDGGGENGVEEDGVEEDGGEEDGGGENGVEEDDKGENGETGVDEDGGEENGVEDDDENDGSEEDEEQMIRTCLSSIRGKSSSENNPLLVFRETEFTYLMHLLNVAAGRGARR